MGLNIPSTAFITQHHVDATATEQDGIEGKIFYNNDGKITGSFKPEIGLEAIRKMYGTDVKSAFYNKNNKGSNSVSYWQIISFTADFSVNSIYNMNSQYDSEFIKISGKLIGLKVSGKTLILPCDTAGICYSISDICSIVIGSDSDSVLVKINQSCNENIEIFYK